MIGIRFLQNIKISNAIILIALFPSLIAVFFANQTILTETQVVQEIKALDTLTNLSRKISHLVHEQQRERGITAGFISSGQKEFERALSEQHDITDKKRLELNNYLKRFNSKTYGESIKKKLDSALAELSYLEHVRDLVNSQSISVSGVIAYYTELNRTQLDTISHISKVSPNTSIAIALVAYAAFLQAKEHAGIERAVGSAGFSSGKFAPEMIEEYTRVVSVQNDYLDLFLLYATEEQKNYYHEKISSPEIEEVFRVRNIISTGGLSGDLHKINGEYFFNTLTKKINILRSIGEYLADDLDTLMDKTLKESHNERQRAILIAIISIIVVVTFSISIVYAVNTAFARIVNSIIDLSQGNLDISLPPRTNNEIGSITRALEIFRSTALEQHKLKSELKDHKDNLEREVKERTSELSELNTELEEFSYRTSHDLRSPIVSSLKLIELSIEAIEKNDVNKANKSLSLAQSGLSKLENLTEDILSLAKSKKLEEELVKINMDVLINNSIEKFSHMEGFETITFHNSFSFDGEFITKQSRITMIVENLISNAIKYKDPQKEKSYIKISTQAKEQHLVLTVEDNGLGIPEEYQKNLFTMFQRFHPKVSFGSGLGLYLMKKSADALGATITFEDTQYGSRFILDIPQ